MSSDEDYCALREFPESLRRSKRIMRSEKKSLEPKVAKFDEKSMKKPSRKKKSRPDKKRKLSQSPKKEESSDTFNGSYLTPEELQQLLIKFTRDGHFHLNPTNVSPPPFVISRTTDGKSVTTKIECYKNNRQLVRDLATTITAPRTEAEVSGEGNKPTSVTFSMPLEKSSCGSSISSKNPVQLIPPNDKNFEPNRKNKCTQKTPNILPDRQRNCFVGNGFSANSAASNLPPKSFSVGGNSQVNGFEMSSDSSGFVNSSQQNLPTRVNLIDPMFMRPTSSTWTPTGSQSTLENRNVSNSCGIYFPSNSTLYNDQGNRFDRDNSKDNSHEKLDLPNSLNRYNNYSNFETTGIHGTHYHHQKETNAQNSTFPLQNSFNPSNEWNAEKQTSSKAISANTSTISSNATTAMPENTMTYISPRFIAYNSEIRSSVNNCMYGIPSNSNSLLNDSNGNHSSTMAWNNLQFMPNSYISADYSSNYNMYNALNTPGRCETATRTIIKDQNNTDSQMNSWSQNNQVNKDFIAINRNDNNNSSPIQLYNFPNNTTMIHSNIPVMMTDPETGISQSSNEQIGKQPTFSLKELREPQNNRLDPTVSSGCSFDDDISYDNYMALNSLYSNENSEEKTTQDNYSSSKLPSVMSIKTEMRSWYDSDNFQCRNNDQSIDTGNAAIYDFETKNKLINSSDCYIIEKPSRS